jgi:hypothetical protein
MVDKPARDAAGPQSNHATLLVSSRTRSAKLSIFAASVTSHAAAA